MFYEYQYIEFGFHVTTNAVNDLNLGNINFGTSVSMLQLVLAEHENNIVSYIQKCLKRFSC